MTAGTKKYGISMPNSVPPPEDRRVPASEGRSWKRLTAAVCAGLMAGAFSFLPVAEARGGGNLPVLDSAGAGVSIDTSGNTMSINSTATNNIIKWVDFSISQGKTVDFNSKNYLNYVTGHARSEIFGTLKGTGNIYLVNPNGILIGDGAVINVGSLYLSTRNLTTDQLTDYATATGELFKAGNLNGDVINMGKLNADVITVEGNNITFKNVADVTKNVVVDEEITGQTLNDSVTLAARGGETHLGYEGTEPTLTGWSKGSNAYMYKLVSRPEELQAINENTDGNYMLAKDITLPDVSEGESNFTPIGSFSGRFDGLGYMVQNLTVNQPDSYYAGLFGRAGSGSVIENVTLSGGSIKGKYYVGVVGSNRGTVRRVYNDGLAVSGVSYVGGIAGNNDGGKVTQVWNTGTVTGTTQVGGLVGLNSGQNATVENAYNAGSVNGVEGGGYRVAEIGGIVGNNSFGTVQNVYNTGNVTAEGGFHTGGIAGFSNDIALVSHAYNTRTVTGTSDSYSVQGTDPSSADAFTGWNIDRDGTNDTAVWRMYEGQNAPLLKAFMKDKDEVISSVVYDGSKDVGAYTVASTKNGTGITQTGDNAINWHGLSIITPKDLTVSFGGTTKAYDGTTRATAGTANLAGVIEGDDVSLNTANLAAAYADKNVGANKTVSYTGIALTGDKAKNYNLTATATGTGTITRKALELVATPVTITQGQESPATFTGELTGFVGNEGMAEGDSLAFATVDPVPTSVGNYAITGTLNGETSGDYGANYTFANAEGNATAFTIKAKPAPGNPGGSGGSGGSGTPTNPVNPAVPTPGTPATPTPGTPAGPNPGTPTMPAPAAPGTPGQVANGPARSEGSLAERLIAEAEAGNLSVATVTELENAAEVAKEQSFAKDMAAVAEMGGAEANTPSPAPSDSGHSYTLLPGGLIALRDDVNSAPASAAMGGKSDSMNASEVMEAAEQADLAIGTEEVHNRQDNRTSDEDSDEQEKKNNKSKQNTKKTETAKEATDK